LGTKSYFFRLFFANYVSELEAGATVGGTDDFICQESTSWSGLGAIAILADARDVSAEDRATLRSWYERHTDGDGVLTRHNKLTLTQARAPPGQTQRRQIWRIGRLATANDQGIVFAVRGAWHRPWWPRRQ